MPAEAKVLASRLTGHYTGLIPTNTKLPSFSQGMSIDVVFKADVMSPDGPVRMDMTSHSEHTSNRERRATLNRACLGAERAMLPRCAFCLRPLVARATCSRSCPARGRS